MESAAAWTTVPKKSVIKSEKPVCKKIPYMLVVGAKEEEEQVVSVRSRYLGDEGQKSLDAFMDAVCKEIRTKEIRKIQVDAEGKRIENS